MTEYTDHFGPVGLRTRGTVVVVPGRGESQATYARFGKRLAADAYRVRVVDGPRIDADDVTGSLAGFGDRLTAAVEGTATGDGTVGPVVFIGADTGAAAVAALVGRSSSVRQPEAVVLAGLPGRSAGTGGSWDDELDIRTSCPAHRGVLTDDSRAERGSLDVAVPGELLDLAHHGDITVPTLILVGEADPLADHDALARTAKSLSRSRLAVVRDAHHDVLNDLQHRSVAAEVVTFLEALRTALVPAVAVESSAW
ncbi:alpha/beta hydrolase [Streptomyces sp. NPDC059582]|uniref:alpha/beta hydrolase n=1 Tax=Streptomyces sp. NPDC059582 TaxID=3346875 RepID=UPI0036B8E96C